MKSLIISSNPNFNKIDSYTQDEYEKNDGKEEKRIA